MAPIRPNLSNLPTIIRQYSTTSTKPRHFLSLADLTPSEFTTLIRKSSAHKTAIKQNTQPTSFRTSLSNRTVGLTFTKRSTRTRISTEGAVTALGGHAMFLGKDDIQFGVNESLRDTSIVMSSMMASIVARVNHHEDVKGLAEYSSVPVINAMCDRYHPLQGLADYLTVYEAFGGKEKGDIGLAGLKVAWVGDATNVLYDLAIGAVKLGINISVANPEGYKIPEHMRKVIQDAAASVPQGGVLSETTVPEEAVKDADVLVTDTWISMGQEAETQKRLKAFAGYQITEEMAKRGGAKKDWKFMHCLPRHPEEVADEVFYSPRSLVFQEAENRLWACIAALEAFVVDKGKIE